MRGLQSAAVLLAIAMLLCCNAGCRAAVFSVRDYGARADGKTNDGPAIQAAVDACVKAGGGTVVLPPGDYASGVIRLASGVTLKVEKGATLLASTRKEDYDSNRRLLVADDADGVAVEGEGVIDGQATADFGGRWGAAEKADFRTGILLFTGCRNVAIRGVTIRNSDSWTLHLKRCDSVVIEDVTIRNNYRRLNSDGIDPNMCRNVRIRRCNIVAGDDCIVLKATEAHPCEDVVVTDCVLESAASALKLGTESHGDFRDVRFERCIIRNSFTGIGFYVKDGATMERVTFKDIRMETCPATVRTVTPIFMDIERRNADSKVGRIRDVTFENIEIRSGSGILIQGMPESLIENLTLRNVRFNVTAPDDYAKRSKPVGGRRTTRDERDTLFARLPTYAAIAYVRGLTLENVIVAASDEAARGADRGTVALRQVQGAALTNVGRTPEPWPGAQPAVDVQDCRDVAGVGAP
jgi:polygalacturonase